MAEERDEKPTLDYAPPERYRIPRYRRILSGTLIVVGAAAAVIPLFEANESARANIWTAAGALIIWGVVIWFRHVRL